MACYARLLNILWNRPAHMAADRSGNVAIMFAMLVIPLVALLGSAIDYSSAYRTKSRVQNALDATALAVNRAIGERTDDQLRQLAADTFASNIGPREAAHLTKVEILPADRVVNLAAATEVPTAFVSIIGIDSMSIGAESTTVANEATFEIALVLDNSGSMSGRKISELRQAAELLTDIMFAGRTVSDSVSIGVVPFAGSVNIGPQYRTASWMDTEAVSPVHSENFSAPVNRFELFDRFSNTSWAGCVESRPQPHDVLDTTPEPGVPESYFVPMFAPDEPDGQSNTVNNYLSDRMSSRDPGWTWLGAQANVDKYVPGARANIRSASSTHTGPNFMCETAPITALTNRRSDIDSAIAGMIAYGLTNIHEGLMWGWRVLSPQLPFNQGMPKGERGNHKIIILMTDGANTHRGISNSPNLSIYTPYGYAANARLRPPTHSTPALVEMMDERTQRACRNAKDDGVVIYTIAFEVRQGETRQLLENCASDRDKFFTPEDGSELIAAFEHIGKELSQLRILK